jgi:dipeptidyl aminopeptidase/acylaminoacyl peptidase
MRGALSVLEMIGRSCLPVAAWVFFLLAVLLAGGCSRSSTFPAPDEANRRIAEITAVHSVFRYPFPDPSDQYLAYVQAVGPGRRLFVLDVKSGENHPIPTTNEVSQVFGWSADSHYLAFAQAPPQPVDENEALATAWVTLYDRRSGAVRRISTNSAVMEGGATWLGTNTLFYSAHFYGTNRAQKFILDLDKQTRREVHNYLNEFVLSGTNLAAFLLNGNLQTNAIDSTNYFYLSHFPPKTFDLMRWLKYRPETGTYLFCARKTNSPWRCLYEFNPATQQLRQLTTDNTYNGQALGGGFAYVGNTSNEFYVALRPADPLSATNLFCDGNVVTYAAGADGRRVYAVASETTEPPGLWEYDVAGKRLRQLLGGQPQPWRASRLVPPEAKWTKSFDGLVIPYFVVPPADLVRNPACTNKFPVMLYLPPPTWQFQRAFDLPAQFFANLNCWYLAVNYRGGDGYGRAFAELQNNGDAGRDALAALGELGSQTNVDLSRVILISESGGGNVAMQLLANSTNQWRGAILGHPALNAGSVHSLSDATPPLFLVAGDLERSTPAIKEFAMAANQDGISTQLFIQKNTGHLAWSTDQIRETLQAEWKFVRERM